MSSDERPPTQFAHDIKLIRFQTDRERLFCDAVERLIHEGIWGGGLIDVETHALLINSTRLAECEKFLCGVSSRAQNLCEMSRIGQVVVMIRRIRTSRPTPTDPY